jgi:flagellar biosynthesis chaperone FliJ
MKLTLKTRIINNLLTMYQVLREMDDYADMYEFIYHEEERDYELTLDQIAVIVEDYMDQLDETIKEAYAQLEEK